MADDMVAEMAGSLTEIVRRADTVARIGPADLVLLVAVPSVDDIDCLARRIADRLRGPFLHEHQSVAVRASVGIATTSCGRDADQLLLMAEVAMLSARDAGGDCHRHFAASPDSV